MTLALLATFVLRPGHWDAEAERWSRLLPHDWPGLYSDHLGELVKSGEACALDVMQDGRRVGILVYDIDNSFPSPELVVLAAYSSAPGSCDVTAECMPQIDAQAATLGCSSWRFHTMRPGLIAKAIRYGCRISECVVRKDVRHV